MADAIAEKYNTTKSQVLDHVSHAALTLTPSKVLTAKSNVSSIITSHTYGPHCLSLPIPVLAFICFCLLNRPLQESKGSVAVRMALGETQIVQETRQFLLDNHVSLDSFSQVRQYNFSPTVTAVRVYGAFTWADLSLHTLSYCPII